MSVLTCEQLTYTYPGTGRPALADISIDVGEGEFVVLAGGSGSGKSTLLRAACGLVPHFYGGEFAGRVTVCGLDTHDDGPGEIGAVAGMLSQDPETQVVMGTVKAELALGLRNRGLAAAAVARGVEETALALGLEQLLDRPTHELSGGELQRVALGASLAGRPQLVLLDEPTSQLDPVAGDELIGLLRRLNEEWGTTILLAEHRLERCLSAADRVLVLDHGTLTCDAPPATFLTWASTSSPTLQTPGARLFELTGLAPPPTGVKEARATLKSRSLLEHEAGGGDGRPSNITRPHPAPNPDPPRDGVLRGRPSPPPARRRHRTSQAMRLDRIWLELHKGKAVLKSIDLTVNPGELVALMGRNGAGKSTLLRCAAGLLDPTRGRVSSAGRVALLLQHPGDYLVHERVDEEVDGAGLRAAGMEALAHRHPRDLSGGERQRLALAIVMSGEEPAAAVCLDEPTRGMDRSRKADLAITLGSIAAAGAGVLVATHDVEFAASFAERVVLLGDGVVIADAPSSEVLTGGWYFATETARILGGAGGALLPEQGAAVLRERRSSARPHLREVHTR